MKTAEQWAKESVVRYARTEDELCFLFQLIQDDAMRHAAEIVASNEGNWGAGHNDILAEAKKLRVG